MSNSKGNRDRFPDASTTAKVDNIKFIHNGNPATALNNGVSFLTLGMKLLIGVGLVSNLCIATLIFVNWHASREIGYKNETLASLRDSLSENLRGEIVNLQDKYMKIPEHLEVDTSRDVLKWVEEHHPPVNENILEGRESYKSIFSRTERRDLANGKFVVHIKDGSLMLSHSLQDDNGVFLDAVKMISLTSSSPMEDIEKVSAEIEALSNGDNSEKLHKNIASLNEMLADEAINAEKARVEIVHFVQKITDEDAAIKEFINRKQRISASIALGTVFVNMVILYLLTWFIVEKPLRKLYSVISGIQQGRDIHIPFLQRRDKIGVLARTIQSFKIALDNLKKEDIRKREEQKMIQGLVAMMTVMIQELQTRARDMAHAASTLHDLASRTEKRSSRVNDSATRTAAGTDVVSDAANRLKAAVDNISVQMETQQKLMEDIADVAGNSKNEMHALGEASREIASIVKIVKDISRQTKLLALNANIEAARSGTQGRGFAVVASEIRQLSSQTETATVDIAGKIIAIQQAGSDMMESIRDIEEKVDGLTRISCHIRDSVGEQKAATGEIAGNARMTSDETMDVSNSIRDVEDAAQQTRNLSSQVQEHTRNISQGLESLLGQTMEKLTGMGVKMGEINPSPEWGSGRRRRGLPGSDTGSNRGSDAGSNTGLEPVSDLGFVELQAVRDMARAA
ncbi:MAG: hypothetical protein HQK66_13970 [Desulfamplus sp.]|nr:hypothetical protein [Desulfamplus sp.]